MIARRILKNAVIRVNDITNLCELNVTEFVMLSVEDIDYGESFMKAIKYFCPESQTDLKSRASEFLKRVFTELQTRLVETLTVIRMIEPFSLENLKICPPKLVHFKSPFFDTNLEVLSTLESQIKQVAYLINENDTTESFWIRMYYAEVGGNFKFRELARGVIKMLALPISNAEVERTFSASNYIKSSRRHWMKKELLENVLYCKFGIQWLNSDLSKFIPPKELLHEALNLSRNDDYSKQ